MLIAIVRTLILYIFIITALRLMGKRQISDMQPSELVVTLVVSDIASLPMQNTSQPLLSGMIPVMVLVGLEILTRTVRKLVCGNPVVVIEDGRLLQKQMKRLRMTNSDLMEQLRQQNVFSLNDVQYCIVETNGALSILEKPEKRVPNAEEAGVTVEDNKLEAVVVSDGKLLKEGLSMCQKDERKVVNILSENHIPMGSVFLMTMDGSGAYRIIRKEEA